MCATLRDLARLGQLFLRRGRAGAGRRVVVPSSWIDDTIRGAPDGARAFVDGDNPPGYPAGAHYRNCWWIRDPSLPFFHAAGINGQHVFVHVPSQTVVVKLSTWPYPMSQRLQRLTVDGVTALASALRDGAV